MVGTKLYMSPAETTAGILELETATDTFALHAAGSMPSGVVGRKFGNGVLTGTRIYFVPDNIPNSHGVGVFETATNTYSSLPIAIGGTGSPCESQDGALMGTDVYVPCKDAMLVIDSTTNTMTTVAVPPEFASSTRWWGITAVGTKVPSDTFHTSCRSPPSESSSHLFTLAAVPRAQDQR